jgi:hypothetical protein
MAIPVTNARLLVRFRSRSKKILLALVILEFYDFPTFLIRLIFRLIDTPVKKQVAGFASIEFQIWQYMTKQLVYY